ncbi:hypothetical protein PAPYR_3822 [Paratrimastix pyriformis]|uniref:Uncharacterized protein n=1 Tax=Paratrimastix pyriformis TaxID=342808 RepID=A0ABQ8ULM0_9EUKA|nr:hypothetical protein PAPYR_3822 [Paratrimastix pyriformis]
MSFASIPCGERDIIAGNIAPLLLHTQAAFDQIQKTQELTQNPSTRLPPQPEAQPGAATEQTQHEVGAIRAQIDQVATPSNLASSARQIKVRIVVGVRAFK